jgi:acetylornithine deacetylase/succinyl-diaminopimelate desuccinylase family protein
MKDQSVLDTLCDLIRINSVNPAYAQGVPESAIQRFIYDFFERAGVAVEMQEVLPDRPNVIAKIPGAAPERRLLFEAHVDTAGVEKMTVSPFEPVISDGRLYGRGACDNKGGLAAMMHALANIKRSGTVPACDVWLAATVDEEHSYRGVLGLCEGLRATGAVVAEPTGMRLVVASKGCLRWRIVVKGRAAHSSKPHLGVSAITPMARLIVALEEEAQELASAQHPLVGPPTLNVGVIQGGAQVNIVPEECYIEIDRRLIPGEDIREVEERYKLLPQRLEQRCPDVRVEHVPLLADWPMETSVDSDIVAVAAAVLGKNALSPEAIGVPFGSDASKLTRIEIPAIVLGPGSIDQAHTADEYVPVDELLAAANVYEGIIRQF